MQHPTPTTDAAGDPLAAIDAGLRRAIVEVLGLDHDDADPVVRSSQNPDFGDFQANGAMGLAKRLGRKPRELAEAIVEAARLEALAEPMEVAGPGFINIRIRPEVLDEALAAMDAGDLGLDERVIDEPVVIDLCGVNVAKQMHVGHLRSTIIGDALARIYERLGATVHRENHLGDWGLPIAMVLRELRASGTDLATLSLPDLDRAYRAAQRSARADRRGLEAARRLHAGPHRIAELEAQNAGAAEAMEAAKSTLVKLQGGDPELLADWHRLIDITLGAVEEACGLLNVAVTAANSRGESFYRDRLADVVESCIAAGHGVEDERAIVVRFEDRERPLLIRKSDGGFLYATTDLAAIRFRVQELGAAHVIYVVDARQRDHFRDVFDAARLMGWDERPDGPSARFVHVPFGSVLGEDGKPLKTRSGENVTLADLLREAIERGTSEVRRRAEDPKAPTHELSEDALAAIGRSVGIGAIKYADLSNDLVRDYVFSFDRMIAFEGNTGPYLQYAHARLGSILRQAEAQGIADAHPAGDGAAFAVREPAERSLALILLRYPRIVRGIADSLEPHRLCAYLFELAEASSTFYQQCPVLKCEDPDARAARLRLSALVRRVLADGLGLLGIAAPDRM